MNVSALGLVTMVGAALCGAALAVAAWGLYQNPALGLLLASFRLCG